MSFLTYRPSVEDGDIVILYLGFSRMKHLKVKKNETYQTQFGAVRHNDLIGSRYGSKIKTSKGWIYVLHPTPELWTVCLPHRTQILYSTDISMVTFQLDLTPGKVVVESGTGSGSLSHALVRAVAPTGHLHTFEFHEQRALQAREEFKEHGLDHLVTIKHRDVCAGGFDLEDAVDAVFLDLPSPWEALPHAKKALKKSGGRICSFSPCIEQVQRTCETMRRLGFREVQTMECLLREYNIQTTNMPTASLGFEAFGETTPGSGPIENTSSGTREPQVGMVQKAWDSWRRKRPFQQRKESDSKKRTKRNDNDGAEEESNDEEMVEEDGVAEVGDNEDEKCAKNNGDDEKCTKDNGDDEKSTKDVNKEDGNSHEQYQQKYVYTCKSAAPRLQIPGHTGYLTFATLFPEFKK